MIFPQKDCNQFYLDLQQNGLGRFILEGSKEYLYFSFHEDVHYKYWKTEPIVIYCQRES